MYHVIVGQTASKRFILRLRIMKKTFVSYLCWGLVLMILLIYLGVNPVLSTVWFIVYAEKWGWDKAARKNLWRKSTGWVNVPQINNL